MRKNIEAKHFTTNVTQNLLHHYPAKYVGNVDLIINIVIVSYNIAWAPVFTFLLLLTSLQTCQKHHNLRGNM